MAEATFEFNTNIEQVVSEITTGLRTLQSRINSESGGKTKTQLSNLPREMAEVVRQASAQIEKLNDAFKVNPAAAQQLRAEYQKVINSLGHDLGRLSSGRKVDIQVGAVLAADAVSKVVNQLNSELARARAAGINVGGAGVEATGRSFSGGYKSGQDTAYAGRIADAAKARAGQERAAAAAQKAADKLADAADRAAESAAFVAAMEAAKANKARESTAKVNAASDRQVRAATDSAEAAERRAKEEAKAADEARRVREEQAKAAEQLRRMRSQEPTAPAKPTPPTDVDPREQLRARFQEAAPQPAPERARERQTEAVTQAAIQAENSTRQQQTIQAAAERAGREWVEAAQRTPRQQERLNTILAAQARQIEREHARFDQRGPIPVSAPIARPASAREPLSITDGGERTGALSELPRLENEYVSILLNIVQTLRDQYQAWLGATQGARQSYDAWRQYAQTLTQMQRALEGSRTPQLAIESGMPEGARPQLTGGPGTPGRMYNWAVATRSSKIAELPKLENDFVALLRDELEALRRHFDPLKAAYRDWRAYAEAVGDLRRAVEAARQQIALPSGLRPDQRAITADGTRVTATVSDLPPRPGPAALAGGRQPLAITAFGESTRDLGDVLYKAGRNAKASGEEVSQAYKNLRDLTGATFTDLIPGVRTLGRQFVADTRNGQTRIYKIVSDGFEEVAKDSGTFYRQYARLLEDLQLSAGLGGGGGLRGRGGAGGIGGGGGGGGRRRSNFGADESPFDSFLRALSSGGGFDAAGRQADGFSAALNGVAHSAGQVLKYGILGQLLYGLQDAFAAVTQEVIEYDTALTELEVALEASGPDLEITTGNLSELGDAAARAGANVGQSLNLAAAALRTYGDAVGDNQQVADRIQANFVNTASALATLSNTNIDQAADNLQAITQAFNIPDQAYSRVLDIVSGAKNIGGGNEEDIATGVANLGVAFKELGFTAEETGAIVAKVTGVTAQSGTLVASRLTRATSILAGSGGRSALIGLNQTLAPEDQIDTTAPVRDQILKLSKVYGTLGDAQRSALTNALGGATAARELIILLENATDLVAKADEGFEGKGLSEYEKKLNDIGGVLKQIQGEVVGIITGVAQSGVLDPLFLLAREALLPALTAVRKILETFNAIPREIRTIGFAIAEIVVAMKLIQAIGNTSIFKRWLESARSVGIELGKNKKTAEDSIAAGRAMSATGGVFGNANTGAKTTTRTPGSTPVNVFGATAPAASAATSTATTAAAAAAATSAATAAATRASAKANSEAIKASLARNIIVQPDIPAPTLAQSAKANKAAISEAAAQAANAQARAAKVQRTTIAGNLAGQGGELGDAVSIRTLNTFDKLNASATALNTSFLTLGRTANAEAAGGILGDLADGGKGKRGGKDVNTALPSVEALERYDRRREARGFTRRGGLGMTRINPNFSLGNLPETKFGRFATRFYDTKVRPGRLAGQGFYSPEFRESGGFRGVYGAERDARLASGAGGIRGRVGAVGSTLAQSGRVGAGAARVGSLAAGFLGPEALITGGVIAAISANQKVREIQNNTRATDVLRGTAVDNNATALSDAAANLKASAEQLKESRTGLIGTPVNLIQRAFQQPISALVGGSGRDDAKLAEERARDLAETYKQSADIIQSARDNAKSDGDLSAQIDTSSTDALTASLDGLSNAGYNSVDIINAMTEKLKGMTEALTSGVANLDTVQVAEVAAGVNSRVGKEITDLQDITNSGRYDKLDGSAIAKNAADITTNFLTNGVDIGGGQTSKDFNNEAARNLLIQQYKDSFIKAGLSDQDAQDAAVIAFSQARSVTGEVGSADLTSNLLEYYKQFEANLAGYGNQRNLDFQLSGGGRARGTELKGSGLVQAEQQQKANDEFINETQTQIDALKAKGDDESLAQAKQLEQALKTAKTKQQELAIEVADQTIANMRANFELLQASAPPENTLKNLEALGKEIDKEIAEAKTDEERQKLETEKAQNDQAIAAQKFADSRARARTQVDPRDELGMADLAIADANAKIADFDKRGVDKNSEEYQKALQEQQAANQNRAKVAAERTISARNVNANPDDSLDAARRQLADDETLLATMLAGSTEYNNQLAKINADKLALAKKETEASISARNTNVLTSSSLDTATRQLADAKDKLNDYEKGTIEYNNQLAQVNAAQLGVANAVSEAASVSRRLALDLTNPVQVANEAVTTARDKLRNVRAEAAKSNASPEAKAQAIGAAELELRSAENQAASAEFSQFLQTTNTANSLGRISHRAYLGLLRGRRDQLSAELALLNPRSNGYKQLQDQINQLDEAIKAGADQLSGQFNIGNIRVPTPYEVRRAIKSRDTGTVLANNGASSVAGNVTNDNSSKSVVLNGVPIQTVMAMIEDLFGVKGRSTGGRKRV